MSFSSKFAKKKMHIRKPWYVYQGQPECQFLPDPGKPLPLVAPGGYASKKNEDVCFKAGFFRGHEEE